MKVPFVYQKLLELDDFKKKDIDLANFQKVLLNFRLKRSDWLAIARDMNGYSLVDIDKGKINQHTKIHLKKRSL